MKITALEAIRIAKFLVGLGETFFSPARVEAYVHEAIAPKPIGHDPFQIERISQDPWATSASASMTGMKALHVGLVNLHLHIAGNHFLNDLRHEVEAAEQCGQGDRTADRPACSFCCSSSPQAEPFCRSRTCAASSGLCPRLGWSRSAFRSS